MSAKSCSKKKASASKPAAKGKKVTKKPKDGAKVKGGKTKSDVKEVKSKPKAVVDLTKTEDDVNEVLSAAVKNEPEEIKFVIDKKKDVIVDAPLYKPMVRVKPRSVKDVLDGLKCHGNLIPPSAVDSSVPKAAIELAEKRKRREAKMKVKRLRSSVRSSKKERPTEAPVDPWKTGAKVHKRLKLTGPLPDEPIFSLPLSYNPNPNSEGLRSAVQDAARVLSTHDRKQAKIEKVASAIRNAKPLSMREQIDEMSAGLFDFDDEQVKEEKTDDEGAAETEPVKKSTEKAEDKRLTKKERKHRKRQERMKLLVGKRKAQNRMMHDFYRLRQIRNEVAAEAARRSATQSFDAQKEASRRRKLAIWRKCVLRRATIQAIRKREAAALIQNAPAEVIGDSSTSGMELGKSLRLIQPRTTSLAFERFVAAQRRGMLLDYRALESSRRAITAHKRHGYKTFEIDR